MTRTHIYRGLDGRWCAVTRRDGMTRRRTFPTSHAALVALDKRNRRSSELTPQERVGEAVSLIARALLTPPRRSDFTLASGGPR